MHCLHAVRDIKANVTFWKLYLLSHGAYIVLVLVNTAIRYLLHIITTAALKNSVTNLQSLYFALVQTPVE
jgi:hypothetical protein